MLVVFVRRSSSSPAEAVHPADLATSTHESAEIALREAGPFVSLAHAPTDAALRERIARALVLPSLARFRRARPWLLLGLFPVLALVDLERQLVSLGSAGVAGRLAADLVVLAFMIVEIARPVPRHSRAWALASLAVAMRYAFMIAAMCGHGLPLFFLGLALSIAAAVLAFLTMPSAPRLSREVSAALQVPAHSRANESESRESIVRPLAASLALPIVLVSARALGAGLAVTALIFVALGTALPFVAPPRAPSSAPRTTRWIDRADAALFGLAFAITLVRLVHYATIATAEALRCAAPHAYETLAKPLTDAQSAESHESGTRFVLALGAVAVLVVPIVEERLYRATLQRALRTRMSAPRAIAASAVVFGLAHLGVYRASIHQAVLLGVAFGATYEEAGLVSAIVAHALYNGAQLF
jgi:membrane protease YdiL (CAAX protease family)